MLFLDFYFGVSGTIDQSLLLTSFGLRTITTWDLSQERERDLSKRLTFNPYELLTPFKNKV